MTLHLVDVHLTCLINITYLLTLLSGFLFVTEFTVPVTDVIDDSENSIRSCTDMTMISLSNSAVRQGSYRPWKVLEFKSHIIQA